MPSRLRVHLVPAEKEATEDTLRYFEATAKGDSSFEFRNLPPGRYWVVVRAIPDEESPENPPQPLAWDAGGRAGLRFEGEKGEHFFRSTAQIVVRESRRALVVGQPRRKTPRGDIMIRDGLAEALGDVFQFDDDRHGTIDFAASAQ